MRKSLQETETIDRYLLEVMDPEERGTFRTRMLTDPDLADTVALQARALRLIRRIVLDEIYERFRLCPSFPQ
jgi:hypothetical protein